MNNRAVKTLTLMCGLPRSGKSTWVKKNKTTEVVVSADDLRYQVYGQRFFKQGEPFVWAVRDVMMRSLLEQGIDIIVDETNTYPDRRKPIIRLAKEHGYIVKCVYVTTDHSMCLERANRECDTAIVEALSRMRGQLIEPSTEEGIDIIVSISEGGNIKEVAFNDKNSVHIKEL